ncbi:hypothetical protein [Pelagibaculum spongiae]|uniref:SMODS and SLOG-associating 2TM effector domain-containing protein n=1 Tax=Pelagibaculum spongiae TaxID=2080658 RepID=A0A2V1GNE7_9GAMM|nr:hypothetical protein [Pelagibaculum spongiae]PVZ63568.1 hypothetical protein DC094_21030 [Pelagibaculum spongiae]
MDFELLLQKPNIEPLDSNTQRIRRNLLIASIIGIILTIGAASFSSQNGLSGFKFENLNIFHVYLFLLVALVYFLCHFLWASSDHLNENKLRLTGIKIPKATVASYASSSTFEPNTDEERQSTLFSWWKGHRQQSEHFYSLIDSIDKNIENAQFEPAINSIKQRIEDMNSKTEYIENALLKFESGFWKHQRSQILRWFLLDVGVPCILAVISIILLSIKVYALHCS